MNRLAVILPTLLLALSTSVRSESDWPQFRGQTMQGISEAKNLSQSWSEDENITWKTAIHGKAWSSPVILGKQVWLSTASADRPLLVV